MAGNVTHQTKAHVTPYWIVKTDRNRTMAIDAHQCLFSIRLTFGVYFACPLTNVPFNTQITTNEDYVLSGSIHYLNPVQCDRGLR